MIHPASALTRRRFLGTTLGGLLLADTIHLHAAPALAGETEHFFYRLAPEGPYIDSQRDNKAFGFGAGRSFFPRTTRNRGRTARSFPMRTGSRGASS